MINKLFILVTDLGKLAVSSLAKMFGVDKYYYAGKLNRIARIVIQPSSSRNGSLPAFQHK